MDNGVCSQVGEPGQGCHQGRGICAGRTRNPNAATSWQAVPFPCPASRDRHQHPSLQRWGVTRPRSYS